jgi:hypothetical protein
MIDDFSNVKTWSGTLFELDARGLPFYTARKKSNNSNDIGDALLPEIPQSG